MSIYFTNPIWLLLAIPALAAILYSRRRSLVELSAKRQALLLASRCVICLARRTYARDGLERSGDGLSYRHERVGRFRGRGEGRFVYSARERSEREANLFCRRNESQRARRADRISAERNEFRIRALYRVRGGRSDAKISNRPLFRRRRDVGRARERAS